MDPQTNVAKSLHIEHLNVIALMKRLGNAVSSPAPDIDPNTLTRLLTDVNSAISGEVIPHFDFEEDTLFPLLHDEGAGDLADLLAEEHVVIRELCEAVKATAKVFLANQVSSDAWAALKAPATELSQRLSAHAEMEEDGLIPLLDSLIDDDQDTEMMKMRAA
ncbi:MAG: hemerythrin domain-containing protein [Rhodospirillales bacterium]|nr:hemerythrin domain-containing protein [Rhodospirillales bacterium]